jgi:hypothetical protein
MTTWGGAGRDHSRHRRLWRAAQRYGRSGPPDVFGYNPFGTAPLARECVALKLDQCASDGGAMRLGESRLAADQCLDADRLGCVEGGVPSGASFAAAVSVADYDLAG